MEHLCKLIDLAKANRIARITYRKTLDEQPSDRLVEPYRSSHNDKTMIIQCWQAAPIVMDGAQWRWFRADRILKVTDGGQNFIPRLTISLSLEEIQNFTKDRERETSAEAVDKYFQFVEGAMIDNQLSDEEMTIAKELAMGVDPGRLKVIHAHIYISVLNELLVDGELTAREERYLGTVKKALGELGWSP